jgi:hypothetical protein
VIRNNVRVEVTPNFVPESTIDFIMPLARHRSVISLSLKLAASRLCANWFLMVITVLTSLRTCLPIKAQQNATSQHADKLLQGPEYSSFCDPFPGGWAICMLVGKRE